MSDPREISDATDSPVSPHMVVESRSRLVRFMWLCVGFFFVGLGLIGIPVPGLPTTPFMILAAACFARSSQRFYDWVISNRLFGRSVMRFREGRGLSLRAKKISVSLMSIFICASVLWGIPEHMIWVKVLTVFLGMFGGFFVLRQPTDNETDDQDAMT